jgi:hypothetical protein
MKIHAESKILNELLIDINIYKKLDVLFEIGGNYKIQELNKCKLLFEDYSKTDSDPLIQEAIGIISAQINYALTSDLSISRKFVQATWDRISAKDRWNFYDIRMLTTVLFFANDIEDLIIHAKEALYQLEKYKTYDLYLSLKKDITFNASSILLDSKFLDSSYRKDYADRFLLEFINTSLTLCAELKDDISFNIMKIRKGIVLMDHTLISSGLDYLKLANETTIYRMVNDDLERYKIIL